jgi:outer membrane lipoprotein SlyB
LVIITLGRLAELPRLQRKAAGGSRHSADQAADGGALPGISVADGGAGNGSQAATQERPVAHVRAGGAAQEQAKRHQRHH